jgi:hypothetical protein
MIAQQTSPHEYVYLSFETAKKFSFDLLQRFIKLSGKEWF